MNPRASTSSRNESLPQNEEEEHEKYFQTPVKKDQDKKNVADEQKPTVDMLVEMGKRMSHLEDQLEKVNEELKLASETIRRKDSEMELLRSQLRKPNENEDWENWPSDPDLEIPGVDLHSTSDQKTIKYSPPIIKVPVFTPVNPLEKYAPSRLRPNSSKTDDFSIQKMEEKNIYEKPPAITSNESLTEISHNNEEEWEEEINIKTPQAERFMNQMHNGEGKITNPKNNVLASQADAPVVELEKDNQQQQKEAIKTRKENIETIRSERDIKEKPKTIVIHDNVGNENSCDKRSELIGKTASEFNDYLSQRKHSELGSTSSVDEAFDDIYDEIDERCKGFIKKFALLKEKMEESSLYGSASAENNNPEETGSDDSVIMGKLTIVISELNDRAPSSDRSGSSVKKRDGNGEELVTLALYADGIQVEGRPFSKYASDSVAEFFRSLKVGYYQTKKKETDSKITVFKILDFRSKTYNEYFKTN